MKVQSLASAGRVRLDTFKHCTLFSTLQYYIIIIFITLVNSLLLPRSRDGIGGACKGTFRGLVGLVAAPVTGALGAVSVVTESVRLSAQYRGQGRPVGKRRKKSRKTNTPFHTNSLTLTQYSSSSSSMMLLSTSVVGTNGSNSAVMNNATLKNIEEADWSGSLPQNF